MSNELFPRVIPPEKLAQHGITIEPELWQFAKDYGNGNASATIRVAVRHLKEQYLASCEGGDSVSGESADGA